MTPTPTPSATITPTATFTATPSATPTATPENWTVLPASDDTYLYSWFPTKNFSGDATLKAGIPAIANALLHFDLGSLPANAIVTQALLKLEVLEVSSAPASGFSLAGYAMLRPWQAGEATWEQAAAGTTWTSAGASGIDDRASTVAAASLLANDLGPATLDVTALIQQWQTDPSSNYGLMIIPGGSDKTVLSLASAEYSLPAWRPRLEITLATSP